jgi:hypothetical protein
MFLEMRNSHILFVALQHRRLSLLYAATQIAVPIFAIWTCGPVPSLAALRCLTNDFFCVSNTLCCRYVAFASFTSELDGLGYVEQKKRSHWEKL